MSYISKIIRRGSSDRQVISVSEAYDLGIYENDCQGHMNPELEKTLAQAREEMRSGKDRKSFCPVLARESQM